MTNFSKLSKRKQKELNVFFKKWLIHKDWHDKNFKVTSPEIVYENFIKDHFCSMVSFNDFSDFITNNSTMDVETLLVSLRNYIWENHLFKGETINVKPVIIGTVVIRDYITTYLSDNYRDLFPWPEDIELFLAKEPSNFDEDERNCLLRHGGRHVWLTWDEVDNNLSPFNFSETRNKNEICDALGLPNFYFIMDTLLVVFRLNNYNHLRKPTIADANFDNDLWRPTPEDFGDYGLTKSISSIKFSNGYNTRRPEAVTKSEYLKLSHLNKRLDNHE